MQRNPQGLKPTSFSLLRGPAKEVAKNPRSSKKEVTQGLKADVFSTVYGPTVSRALIQSMSFSAACKVVP